MTRLRLWATTIDPCVRASAGKCNNLKLGWRPDGLVEEDPELSFHVAPQARRRLDAWKFDIHRRDRRRRTSPQQKHHHRIFNSLFPLANILSWLARLGHQSATLFYLRLWDWASVFSLYTDLIQLDLPTKPTSLDCDLRTTPQDNLPHIGSSTLENSEISYIILEQWNSHLSRLSWL